MLFPGMSISRGRFITLEGGEGAGKTTQRRLLAAALAALGISAVETREPGGCPSAEAIRKLIFVPEQDGWDTITQALLMSAARREHLVQTILPALEEGEWVISDRFADSTMAYQGYGLGVARDNLAMLYRLIAEGFVPDLTLILDLDPAVGLARATVRQHYEMLDIAFHQRLREGFLTIAAAAPERCVIINAAQPLEAVQADIWAAVKRRLRVAVAE
jgi:dTMP kinase